MDSSESNSSYGKAAYISFAVWIAISFVPALASVFVFTEDWFADLAKPSWNPPNWLFGPVWSALYLSMGIAAWLVWQQGGWVKQKQPLTLFLIQLVLNAIWTPLFFGLHRIDWAMVEIVFLWLAVVATIIGFWRARPVAGYLLVPYLMWISFATCLNFAIWRLNGG
jgi:translocator protein